MSRTNADGVPLNGQSKLRISFKGEPKRRPITQSRVDGWFNALSGHGTREHSKSANSDFQILILDDESARDLWRQDDIAARIVETIPAEAFRRGFKLNMEDKEAAEEVMAIVEEQKLVDFFIKALEFERAYGGSAIYPVINDGQADLSQPLNLDRIPTIESALVFEARELQPSKWYGDLTQPKFGLPEVYQLTAYTEGTAAPPSEQIHESRLVIFPGIRVSRTQTSQRTSWGDSVLSRVVTVLRDFNISWSSAAELLNDFAQAVFKIKGLAELIASDKDDVIKARIRAVQLSRSSIRATMMDAEEEFERKQTPISGMPELLDRFSTRLAAAADMPVTLLMGQSPAGLNATGESDIRFFYDRVAAVQAKKIKSQLERCIQLIFRAKDGPTKGQEPDTWSIEFNPLWSPTEKEVADTRKVVADTDAIYIANQVVSPEEVRVARYGGDEYSADLHIDIKETEELEKELTPEEEEAARAANGAVTGADIAADAAVAQTAMNGAQVGALVSIVVSAGAREISRESAKNIIMTAFPTVSEAQAEGILGPKEFAPEPEETPTPLPPPPQPGSEETEDEDVEESDDNPGSDDDTESEDRADARDNKDKRHDKIEKRGSKWVVLSADGSQVLGTHDTRVAAQRQLRAIEAAKKDA